MPSAGEGIGTRKSDNGLKPGEVNWPENARSIIVIAVAHPEEAPEMDWWYGRVDPPGNRVLAKVCRELCPWIEESFGINTVHLPYHVEKGAPTSRIPQSWQAWAALAETISLLPLNMVPGFDCGPLP